MYFVNELKSEEIELISSSSDETDGYGTSQQREFCIRRDHHIEGYLTDIDILKVYNSVDNSIAFNYAVNRAECNCELQKVDHGDLNVKAQVCHKCKESIKEIHPRCYNNHAVVIESKENSFFHIKCLKEEILAGRVYNPGYSEEFLNSNELEEYD